MTARRFALLLLVAAADVAVWSLAGVFATSEFYRRSIVLGGAIATWSEVLDVQMCTALLWAAVTPLVFLLAQRLPLRAPHLVRNAVLVTALIPCLAALRAAVGGVVLNLGEHDPVSLSMVLLSLRIRTHRDIAILAAIFFVSNLADMQREVGRRERQRVEAQTLLARTQLEDLRSRLQPRFAVRMLRHIGSVLRSAPHEADSLILTLSGILRRSMAAGAGEPVPLADELEQFDQCLDLCRSGGGLALDVRYVVEDDVLACRVPARVLQPAIESAVLDLTPANGGSVEVRCARDASGLSVDVEHIPRGGAAVTTSLCIPYQEATA